MELAGVVSPAAALTAAARVLQAPSSEMLPELSAVLAEVVPHQGAAALVTQCAHLPLRSTGGPGPAGRITSAELGPLLVAVTPGCPFQGTALVGGAEHAVLAVASDHTQKGALLVLVRADGDAPLGDIARHYVQAFWDLVTSHLDRVVADAIPAGLNQSRAAATARATAVAELTEAHAASLAGLLGVLRSRRLDDAAARSAAIDLAVTAIVELRAETDTDGSRSEEPARQAFGQLAEWLRRLMLHSPVQLELSPPSDNRLVPAHVAHGMRAAVRSVVLALLRQEDVGRVRVGWQLNRDELRATVRDDGPGAPRDDLAVCRIADRVKAMGGGFEVDAVPDWGMTVTLTVPLYDAVTPGIPAALKASTSTGPGAPRSGDPLAELGQRELEVLAHLALGHRNRTIAQELHISESTVKFHVANILTKLGVGSRGEAAALFHAVAA